MSRITDRAVVAPVLESPEDVRAWFRTLLKAGINFHPEDTFHSVVDYATGEPSFYRGDADRMDEAMGRAYALVDDPCVIANEVYDEMESREPLRLIKCSGCGRDRAPGWRCRHCR